VALSLILQLNQEAMDLSVRRLVPTRDGHLLVTVPPAVLKDDDVVALDIYGSLFYAGSRTLQAKLPDPGTARRASVILRLRGRTTFGATFAAVITDYAQRLAVGDGTLYLSGLDPRVASAWERRGLPGSAENVRLYLAQERLGDSTYAAVQDALVHRVHVEPV
jgi:SulP family sulfate permease